MIIVAVFALNVAHPGPVFAGREIKGARTVDSEVEAVGMREGK